MRPVGTAALGCPAERSSAVGADKFLRLRGVLLQFLGFQLLNYQISQLPNASFAHFLWHPDLRRPLAGEARRRRPPHPSGRNPTRPPQRPRPRTRPIARQTIRPEIEPPYHPTRPHQTQRRIPLATPKH